MTDDKNNNACCQLEAVVSFDDRGQLVLPKDIRKKFNLNPGEKFAIISCMENEKLCCLTLIKANALNNSMKDFLNPIVAAM